MRKSSAMIKLRHATSRTFCQCRNGPHARRTIKIANTRADQFCTSGGGNVSHRKTQIVLMGWGYTKNATGRPIQKKNVNTAAVHKAMPISWGTSNLRYSSGRDAITLAPEMN